MSGNTFGTLFAVTNFGESHGPAIGCVIDGCPPGMELSAADIQPDLDRRRPGTSRHVTQRQEADQVEILSGVYEGRTTGTPICLLIRNTDQRSKDYSAIARPSARATPTTPTCRSTACAIRAAAAGPRPASRRQWWPPARWPRSGWP
jgi:chorismate synthase